MSRARRTARIHVIAAKNAPVAVLLRQKPTRTWHILKWDLRTDALTPGSWFHGKLYPLRSDVSWDGKLMSYMAMGNRGQVWSGICQPPRLKTLVHWANTSTFNGSAVWLQPDVIYRNLIWMDHPPELVAPPPETRASRGLVSKLTGWVANALSLDGLNWDAWSWRSRLNFDILDTPTGEDFSILFHRLHRDGWRPCIDGQPGPDVFDDRGQWISELPFGKMVDNEDGWIWQPTKRHPLLRVRYAGYLSDNRFSGKRARRFNPADLGGRTGYILIFDLPALPGVLGPAVDWATWTCDGDLVYALQGSVYRYDLDSLRKGRPPARIDLEGITRPEPRAGPTPRQT